MAEVIEREHRIAANANASTVSGAVILNSRSESELQRQPSYGERTGFRRGETIRQSDSEEA